GAVRPVYMMVEASTSMLFIIFDLRILPTPISTLFPYTTLFRSLAFPFFRQQRVVANHQPLPGIFRRLDLDQIQSPEYPGERLMVDRKSTRLNSSHVANSYAVFCQQNKTSRN